MIHQYKLNNFNIVLDVCSGSIHVVDEVAYEIIAMYESKSKGEILSTLTEKYKDREDITVADIQHISLKPNHWQITDTKGNTYSAYESDAVIEQIILQGAYHIVYAPNHNNGIRAMTHGDTIIVDYAHSISVHTERSVWDWVLMSLGLVGSLTTVICMVIDIRKHINHR